MTERLLPLFPLPLVLFPGVPLPLHIFEPRYREMLANCLATDRRFGLVFIPDGESSGPGRGDIGCVALIQTAEELSDGRSNIIVVGEHRFAIGRIVRNERPYLLGEVASYADLDGPGRQRLLASRSPLGRLRELDALLSPAVDTLESRAVIHARAKTNGHGPGASH